MKYRVELEVTFRKEVVVEASSREEAEEIAEEEEFDADTWDCDFGYETSAYEVKE